MTSKSLPSSIRDVEQLEELLSEPTAPVIDVMAQLDGDVLVLGVGGKMGPTMARMAKRASELAGVARRVIGVSRFSSGPELREQLHARNVETIACDLLNPVELEQLPEAPNVVYLAGMKFGTTGRESQTWAMNCLLPGLVCRRFRNSRIVLLSTGNVYPLSPIARGGSMESDALQPVGEYAMSCLGRERVAEHCCRDLGIPMAIIRLNYAVEMRYGVPVDIAQRVWRDETIDVSMGAFNAVWQGDANTMSLASFARASTPPFVINVTGPELLSVRGVAEQFGRLFGKEPRLEGDEASDALISNAQRAHRLFGYPHISAAQMIEWIADWIRRDGALLGKPTHFEARDGKY